MKPRTYLIGVTQPISLEVERFLRDTGNESFIEEFRAGYKQHGPLALVSLYAKLCYRSLSEGKNSNITKTRSIEDNLKATLKSGHGSVFEHVNLNFVTVGCSRVFTHELVRHRVGTAFSQTSGRYCTVEDAEMVLPDELKNAPMSMKDGSIGTIGAYMSYALEDLKAIIAAARISLNLESKSFAEKKWWTSALRRIMPNGANNEIGWSVNVRTLRHIIEMRTSRHAEWELRHVFDEVSSIIENYCPLMLEGGKCEVVDGYKEWTGLKV